jgi:hypothetical protein
MLFNFFIFDWLALSLIVKRQTNYNLQTMWRQKRNFKNL